MSGRWLKKIEKGPDSIPTKPTKPSFVSFVSAPPGAFREKGERGRRILERMAREFDHDLDDLLDWYQSDLEDIAEMPIEHVRLAVRDYIGARTFYRTYKGASNGA